MSGLQIADALTGKSAAVDNLNRLQVRSVSEPIQHWISHERGLSFQVLGETTLASGTVWPLFIKNTDTTNQIVFTRIRHQVIDQAGGTAIPNVNNYLKMSFDTTYTSGGTALTPANMHRGKANSPVLLAYSGATLSTTNEIIADKWFTQLEADMYVWDQEGSLILSPGQTLAFGYTGNQTSGLVSVRVSFVIMGPGE